MDKQKDSSNKTTTANKPAKKSSNWISFIMATVALIIAILALVGISLAFYKQNQDRIEINQSQRSNTQQVAQMTNQLGITQKSLERTEEIVMQQQRLLSQTNNKLRRLSQLAGDISISYELEESMHLAKLAVYNLTFSSNVSLATKLLEAADQNIAAVGDDSLIPVRRELANSIARLEATHKVDTSGLILRLGAISQEVERLPLPMNLFSDELKNADSTLVESESKSWHQNLRASIENLQNLVVVRNLEEPIKPLLVPDRQSLLVENIQLQLVIAQWAILHRESAIYIDSLQRALQWVAAHFDPNAAVTKSVLNNINELLNQDINPGIPDISPVLGTIEAALEASTKSGDVPAPGNDANKGERL